MFGIIVLCVCVYIAGLISGPIVRRFVAETVTEIKAEYADKIARVTAERDDAETALLKFKANRDAQAAEAEASIHAESSKLIAAAEAEALDAKAELTKLRNALEVMAGLQKAPDPVSTEAPAITQADPPQWTVPTKAIAPPLAINV